MNGDIMKCRTSFHALADHLEENGVPRMDAFELYERYKNEWQMIKELFDTTGMDEVECKMAEDEFNQNQMVLFERLKKHYGSLEAFVALSSGCDSKNSFENCFRLYFLSHCEEQDPKKPWKFMSRPVPNYDPSQEVDATGSEDEVEEESTPQQPIVEVDETPVSTKQANSLSNSSSLAQLTEAYIAPGKIVPITTEQASLLGSLQVAASMEVARTPQLISTTQTIEGVMAIEKVIPVVTGHFNLFSTAPTSQRTTPMEAAMAPQLLGASHKRLCTTSSVGYVYAPSRATTVSATTTTVNSSSAAAARPCTLGQQQKTYKLLLTKTEFEAWHKIRRGNKELDFQQRHLMSEITKLSKDLNDPQVRQLREAFYKTRQKVLKNNESLRKIVNDGRQNRPYKTNLEPVSVTLIHNSNEAQRLKRCGLQSAHNATLHMAAKQIKPELRFRPVLPNNVGPAPSIDAESRKRKTVMVPSNKVCRIVKVEQPPMQKKPIPAAVSKAPKKVVKRRKPNSKNPSNKASAAQATQKKPKKELSSPTGACADDQQEQHTGISKFFQDALASSVEVPASKPPASAAKASDASANYRKNQGSTVNMIRVSEDKNGAVKRRGANEQHSRPKMIRVSEAKEGETLRTIENLDLSKTPKVEEASYGSSLKTTPTKMAASPPTTPMSSPSSTPPSSTSTPPSSPSEAGNPRDRSHHNEIEKVRREEIKVNLQKLRDCVMASDGNQRPSKKDICDGAANLIKRLESEGPKLFDQKKELVEKNRSLRRKLRALAR